MQSGPSPSRVKMETEGLIRHLSILPKVVVFSQVVNYCALLERLVVLLWASCASCIATPKL